MKVLRKTYQQADSITAADLLANNVYRDDKNISTQNKFRLSEDRIRQYDRDGYMLIPKFVSATDVEQIRELLTSLYARFDKLPNSLTHNLDEHQNLDEAPRNPEIGRCLWLEPKLTKTRYFQNIKEIARQLLGAEARICFDHAIFKPPYNYCPTKWHQDEAYEKPDGSNLRASFWLPLQDVTVESGCLQYIPGSHKGELFPHRPVAEGAHALTTDRVDVDRAISCPVSAGTIAIHHGRTLHYAGPNITNQPRLAWVVVFAVGGSSPYAQLMRLAAPFGQTFLGWSGRTSLNLD